MRHLLRGKKRVCFTRLFLDSQVMTEEQHHRPLKEILVDYEKAETAWDDAKKKADAAAAEAKKQLDALNTACEALRKELHAHPEKIAAEAREERVRLHKVLGDYLYEELVVELGLSEITLAEWKVETRHHNQYNDCNSVTVILRDKKYKREAGDWGSSGHRFKRVPRPYEIQPWEYHLAEGDKEKTAKLAKRQALLDGGEFERKGKTVEWAWEQCCVHNPENDAGAVMALVDMALEWQGIDGIIEEAGDVIEGGGGYDAEDHRECDFIKKLVPELCKMLECPRPIYTMEDSDEEDEEEDEKTNGEKRKREEEEEDDDVNGGALKKQKTK